MVLCNWRRHLYRFYVFIYATAASNCECCDICRLRCPPSQSSYILDDHCRYTYIYCHLKRRRVSISLYPYQDGRDGKLRALTVGGWRESLSLIEWTTRQETHMWSASEMFFFFNALVWTLHQRKLFVWSGCKVLYTSVLEYIPYIRFHPHANAIHFEHKHMLSSSLADDIRQVILLSPQLYIHTFVYAFCEMQLNNLQRTECAARSPSPFILTNNVRPETGWQNLQFTS